MKRYNHLFEKIVSIENLDLAERKARKGKSHRPEVLIFLNHREELLELLRLKLINCEYKTSTYTTFTIYEPKERIIFKLPYYPDRIVHHAIMNVMERIWVNQLLPNVYNCIKGRGIHKAASDLKRDLRKDPKGTKYCLKLDIRKFYPSINHDVLKAIIRRKLKDKLLLQLLDEIVDSADGVPIGNYLSQFFANITLCYFDRDVVNKYRIYYYRYADDVVILSDSKLKLHNILDYILFYLDQLQLRLKDNYQVFPIEKHGISFVGYVFYHYYTLLRKNIKYNLCKLASKLSKLELAYNTYKQSICCYLGWLKYCDSYNLSYKILKHKELLVYINCVK